METVKIFSIAISILKNHYIVQNTGVRKHIKEKYYNLKGDFKSIISDYQFHVKIRNRISSTLSWFYLVCTRTNHRGGAVVECPLRLRVIGIWNLVTTDLSHKHRSWKPHYQVFGTNASVKGPRRWPW